MPIYRLICIIFLCISCSSNPLISKKDRFRAIVNLENKIGYASFRGYGDLVIKYDLFSLYYKRDYRNFYTSKLYHELLSNNYSRNEFLRNTKILESKFSKSISKKQFLANTQIVLTKLNCILSSQSISKYTNYNYKNHNYSKLNIKQSIKKLRYLDSMIEKIPINQPIMLAHITSGFGRRLHPIVKKHRFHAGVDFKGSKQANIIATASGKVKFAGFNNHGYGNLIIIDHGNKLTSHYAHLNKIYVKQHEKILVGQIIATQGRSGKATSDHLHYEIRFKGAAINPKFFLMLTNNCSAN